MGAKKESLKLYFNIKCTAFLFLALYFPYYGALCQERAPRLVAATTMYIYTDDSGNKVSFTMDSVHDGYRSPDRVKVKLLGIHEQFERYGALELFNEYEGLPDYGLFDVIPAKCDTELKFFNFYFLHTKRADSFESHFLHTKRADSFESYELIVNQYDDHNNLVFVQLFRRHDLNFYSGLEMEQKTTYAYDDRNNCIQISNLTYYTSKKGESSICRKGVRRFAYDEHNKKIYECGSTLFDHGQNTHITYDSTGRILLEKYYEDSSDREPYFRNYQYSKNQNCETITFDEGDSIIDFDGNKIYNQLPKNLHTYYYDQGKIIAVSDEDNYPSPASIRYDDHGRLINEILPEMGFDKEWKWEYNKYGLPRQYEKKIVRKREPVYTLDEVGPLPDVIIGRYYYQ